MSHCWDENPDVRLSFSDLGERIETIYSHWKGLTNSLQNKMEEILLADHDDISGSTGDLIGNRRIARYSSSSTVPPISPSQRKLSTQSSNNSLQRTREPSGYIVPSNTSCLSDEYSRLSRYKSEQNESSSPYDFLSQPLDNWNTGLGHRQPSLENFGRTLDRRQEEEDTSPIPIFEKLYDEQSSVSQLHVVERSFNSSGEPHQSLSLEPTHNTAVADYSLPVHHKPFKKKNRSSSKSSTAPLLCSTSTTTSHTGSLDGHHYFTLERPENTSVFDEDTDSSDIEERRGVAKVGSRESSKSVSPILAYENATLNPTPPPPPSRGTEVVPSYLASGRMISNSSLLSTQIPLQQFYVMEK